MKRLRTVLEASLGPDFFTDNSAHKRLFRTPDTCTQIDQENIRYHLFFVLLSLIAGSLLHVASYMIPSLFALRFTYLLFISFSVLEVILNILWAHSMPKRIHFLIFIAFLKTYYLAILSGVVHNTEALASSFYIIMLLMAILFLMPQYQINLLNGAACLIFSVLSYLLKDWEYAAKDILTCFLCYVMVCIASSWILKLRLNHILTINTYQVQQAQITKDNQALQEAQNLLLQSDAITKTAIDQTGIIFWIFNTKERTISLSHKNSIPGDFPIHNVPESLPSIYPLHPDDIDKVIRLHEEILLGSDHAQARIRIKDSNNNQYSWYHIVYSVVPNEHGDKILAIGSAMEITSQQMAEQRYLEELRFRQKQLDHATVSYQLNLSQSILEEYRSDVGMPKYLSNLPLSDDFVYQSAASIPDPMEHEQFISIMNTGQLIQNYHRGIYTNVCIYRRQIPSLGLRWIKTTATTIRRPSTGDIIALIYAEDVHDEIISKHCIDNALREGTEDISYLDVHNNLARCVKHLGSSSFCSVDYMTPYEAVLERCMMQHVFHEDREVFRIMLQKNNIQKRLESEPSFNIYYRSSSSTGEMQYKKMTLYYLDQARDHIVFVRRDITDIVTQEQKQKEELKKALLGEKKANQAKSDFLSRMSHDIRTPLNAIIGLSTLGLDETHHPEVIQNYLGQITQSGEHLLRLINDILDMSKIEQHKVVLHPEVVDVKDYFDHLFALVKPQLVAKKIHFEIKRIGLEAEYVKLDRLRIEQIFINLMSNAIKFTQEGGTITFVSNGISMEDRIIHHEFRIIDTGSGMKPEFIDNLFLPFEQEHPHDIKLGQGTGLGLSIVKNLVDLMGGSIRVQSTLGIGSSFILDLFFEIADSQDYQENSQKVDIKPVLLGGKRLLLVEDSYVNREIAKSFLMRIGLDVEEAENGEEAITMYASKPAYYYQAIIMDIHMPIMNGLDATKSIRSLQKEDAQSVPIIAMTANAFDEDVYRSLSAGMNAHLAKPINPGLLYKTLTEQLMS